MICSHQARTLARFLSTLSEVAVVQQAFASGASGKEGARLIAWSNPPAQPKTPFTGRTVFMFRDDLFDDVAALAFGPAPVEDPTSGSGEGGRSNKNSEDSEPESEIELPGLEFSGPKVVSLQDRGRIFRLKVLSSKKLWRNQPTNPSSSSR